MKSWLHEMTVLLACGLAGVVFAQGTPHREDEVRTRGADVMPFALADTVHIFEKTPTGGVQQVRARAGDPDQVLMIRVHLLSIADSFATRDFSGPAHVHGDAMPGLAELRNAKNAIHRWFDAQLADHGHDATRTW